MKNAGLPPGLPQESNDFAEFDTVPLREIPEAVREVPAGEAAAVPKRTRPFWLFGAGTVFVVLGIWWLPRLLAAIPETPNASPAIAPPLDNSAPQIMAQAIALINGEPTTPLLNHLPYAEAPRADLKPVTADKRVLLRRSAAAKFQQMVAAAKAEGVILVSLSGFRSIADQERIFFELKAQRGENPANRAAVSAPPGYSEHHTGYAIDLGDGNRPATDLQTSFETTAAFRWLKQNAAFYSFELSFPKNNPMGVSYEPWHWRFVGDRTSLETFYRARSAVKP